MSSLAPVNDPISLYIIRCTFEYARTVAAVACKCPDERDDGIHTTHIYYRHIELYTRTYTYEHTYVQHKYTYEIAQKEYKNVCMCACACGAFCVYVCRVGRKDSHPRYTTALLSPPPVKTVTLHATLQLSGENAKEGFLYQIERKNATQCLHTSSATIIYIYIHTIRFQVQ